MMGNDGHWRAMMGIDGCWRVLTGIDKHWRVSHNVPRHLSRPCGVIPRAIWRPCCEHSLQALARKRERHEEGTRKRDAAAWLLVSLVLLILLIVIVYFSIIPVEMSYASPQDVLSAISPFWLCQYKIDGWAGCSQCLSGCVLLVWQMQHPSNTIIINRNSTPQTQNTDCCFCRSLLIRVLLWLKHFVSTALSVSRLFFCGWLSFSASTRVPSILFNIYGESVPYIILHLSTSACDF